MHILIFSTQGCDLLQLISKYYSFFKFLMESLVDLLIFPSWEFKARPLKYICMCAC